MAWFKNLPSVMQVLVSGSIFLVVILITGLVLLKVRKWSQESQKQDVSSLGTGFSIDDLDALRQAGQLSDEEFRMLRRRALHLDAGPAKADNPLTDKGKPDDGKEEAPKG
jgi:hypothetical protein